MTNFIYGIDSAAPLTETALSAVTPGPSWVAVYIGGPTNGGRWTPADARAITHYHKLPIYVGQNVCPDCARPVLTAVQGDWDGMATVNALEQYGFVGGPVALDVEERTYAANETDCRDYVESWIKTIAADGWFPVVYGPRGLLETLQPKVRFGAWLSYWLTDKSLLPVLSAIPLAEPSRFAALAWQFRNAGAYDLSISDLRMWDDPMPSAATAPDLAGEIQGNRRYFPETGFFISQGFRAYWEKYGDLAVYGYPLSREYVRLMPDGSGLTVQMFERARFEWHPGTDPARFDVQLGRIGAELLAANHDQVNYANAFQKEVSWWEKR